MSEITEGHHDALHDRLTQALARIRALESGRDLVTDLLKTKSDAILLWMARAEKAEARVAELEAQLHAEGLHRSCDFFSEGGRESGGVQNEDRGSTVSGVQTNDNLLRPLAGRELLQNMREGMGGATVAAAKSSAENQECGT